MENRQSLTAGINASANHMCCNQRVADGTFLDTCYAKLTLQDTREIYYVAAVFIRIKKSFRLDRWPSESEILCFEFLYSQGPLWFCQFMRNSDHLWKEPRYTARM